MVLALALVLWLVLGAALASMVTAPLRHMAHATRTMAGGDLNVKVPGTRLEELDALAACRTHEIDGQILKQMESTSAFSATKFFLAGNLDSFVSPFG
jgi:nitrogen fixation/metabolism regulation signal transduction histidine kinase